MLEYRFDTQLLIDGENLSEDEIHDYIQNNIEGDCLIAAGDDELIKIHFHTNTAHLWAISSMWWWKTWKGRSMA